VKNPTPTQARQGSPRKTNFRVLLISTALAVLVLGAFAVAFIRSTPPQMSDEGQQATPTTSQTGTPPALKPLPKSPDTYNPGDKIRDQQ
jgi:hypothetical protein